MVNQNIQSSMFQIHQSLFYCRFSLHMARTSKQNMMGWLKEWIEQDGDRKKMVELDGDRDSWNRGHSLNLILSSVIGCHPLPSQWPDCSFLFLSVLLRFCFFLCLNILVFLHLCCRWGRVCALFYPIWVGSIRLRHSMPQLSVKAGVGGGGWLATWKWRSGQPLRWVHSECDAIKENGGSKWVVSSKTSSV